MLVSMYSIKQGTRLTPQQQLIRHVETPTVRVYNCECTWLCSKDLVYASLSADAMTSSRAVCDDADVWVPGSIPTRSSATEAIDCEITIVWLVDAVEVWWL